LGVSVLVASLFGWICVPTLADTGDPVRTLELGSIIKCAAFSPGGEYLAVGCTNGTVYVLSTELWEPVWEKSICDGRISTIAFSPDGQILVSDVAGEPVVVFLNANTGRETRRVDLGEEFGGIDDVAFSPDGTLLACAEFRSSGDVVRVKLIDGATGDDRGTPIQYQGYTVLAPIQVAFSPDGRLLMCASWGRIIVWDLVAQVEIESLSPVGFKKAYDLAGVAISPDGALLVAVGENSKKVLLWDTETWTLRSLAADGEGTSNVSVAFSPNGRFFAYGYKDFIIRDGETQTLLWSQSSSRRGTTWVGFSSDSSLFAGIPFNSRFVTLWNVNELVGE